MSTIALIEAAIKPYARGLITEREALKAIKEILRGRWNAHRRSPTTGSLPCPVLDVYGLGAERDPEAYGLPRRD